MKALLVTLHAKYAHSSLALPYLAAASLNIEGLQCCIREYTINDPIDRTLARIYRERPDIIAFSCYIWNIEAILHLATDLKLLLPHTMIILGGPEASCGSFDLMERNHAIDVIIRNEGEETFRILMERMVSNGTCVPPKELENVEGLIVRTGSDSLATSRREQIKDLDSIPSPFAAGLVDLSKPLVYYETSRGCPFSCAFCMSSIESGVRSFSRSRIEADLAFLMVAEVSTIKLVDRTFNYNAQRANEIWSFILRNNIKSRFHFEIAADLLTDENIDLLAQVPPDTFRFEIGVQAGTTRTLEQVERYADLDLIKERVRQLKARTEVTLHLDLIAGLPQETLAGFFSSVEELLQLHPHHIQVEPLKVLKGTAMRKIAEENNYRFSPRPPYKILSTPWLSFPEIVTIETFSRLLDLIHNSGRFATFLNTIRDTVPLSVFFAELADYRMKADLPEHIPLHELFSFLYRFCSQTSLPAFAESWRDALAFDLCTGDHPGKATEILRPEAILPSPPKHVVHGLAANKGASPGRIRSFAARFSRDYRTVPYCDTQVDLLFIYRSVTGGHNVSVTEIPSR